MKVFAQEGPPSLQLRLSTFQTPYLGEAREVSLRKLASRARRLEASLLNHGALANANYKPSRSVKENG